MKGSKLSLDLYLEVCTHSSTRELKPFFLSKPRLVHVRSVLQKSRLVLFACAVAGN